MMIGRTNGGVLVAGGSGGIGHAVIERLRRKNYPVAVIDQAEPRQSVEAYVPCDLEQLEQIPAAVAAARATLGSIDTLLMCAGRYDAATLESTTLDSFVAVLHVNLVSVMVLVKAWLDSEAFNTPGVIILVSSAAAHIGSRDPAYSSSKAGLLGLSRSLALNLTYRGFSVFSVSPGVVRTPMSDRQPRYRRAEHVSRTLHKRAAEPCEIAEVIVWLVESRPHYMSGTDFNMSGGLFL